MLPPLPDHCLGCTQSQLILARGGKEAVCNQCGSLWLGYMPPKPAPALRAQALRLQIEIQQLFTDADYWNRYTRAPDEAPIDPDPDGQLGRMLNDIENTLKGLPT